MLASGIVFSSQRADLWLELGKVGLQLLAVGIVGGALSAGWKIAEEDRAEARREAELDRERRQDFHSRQLSVFVQVVTAYNGVKAVRRALFSHGFAITRGVLDALQAQGFHDQMARLNELQLVFEAILRELGETNLFGSDTSEIVRELSGVEHHLNEVLRFWQNHGFEIRAGISADEVAKGVEGLLDSRSFGTGVVEPRRRLTEAMHRHLFGIASSADLAALSRLERHSDP